MRPPRTKPKPTPTLEDLKTEYLTWLYGVIFGHQIETQYWLLANTLFKIDYYWTIPNDDNRGEDGKQFRHDFSLGYFNALRSWWDGPCTVFEMITGVACRMEDILENPVRRSNIGDWFILLISNLGLKSFTDDNWSSDKEHEVHKKIDILLKRNYDRYGNGGLFPLEGSRVKNDQRKVEIWYQMMSYIDESFEI